MKNKSLIVSMINGKKADSPKIKHIISIEKHKPALSISSSLRGGLLGNSGGSYGLWLMVSLSIFSSKELASIIVNF